MSSGNKLGQEGEALAAAWLGKEGYEILERNWRSGHSEIDLIARKEDIIVFVEVKTRKNADFGFPEDSVDAAKEKSLARGARDYLEKNKLDNEIRFDIISIIKAAGRVPEIYHIPDAFFPKNA